MSVCFDKDVRDTANNKRKNVVAKKKVIDILPQDEVELESSAELESVSSTDSNQSKR